MGQQSTVQCCTYEQAPYPTGTIGVKSRRTMDGSHLFFAHLVARPELFIRTGARAAE